MSLINEEQATALLRAEKIVALPTETVYGLAGVFDSKIAIESIFTTKKRPSFDPLILHVSSIAQAQTVIKDWSPVYTALAEEFWPGPLTLVGAKTDLVSPQITAGLETVAVRSPRHPVFLSILNKLGKPLAAPSANQFSKTSPTQAGHVLSEFENKVPVVDGGSSEVGIESTIISIESFDKASHTVQMRLLRPGMLSAESIVSHLSTKGYEATVQKTPSHSRQVVAPGQMKVHYRPSKPLILFSPKRFSSTELKKLLHEKHDYSAQLKPILWRLSIQPALVARTLYSEMREFSQRPGNIIFCEWPHSVQPSEEWLAIFNRLDRASELKCF